MEIYVSTMIKNKGNLYTFQGSGKFRITAWFLWLMNKFTRMQEKLNQKLVLLLLNIKIQIVVGA